MAFQLLWADLGAAMICAVTLWLLVLKPLNRFRDERQHPFTDRMLRPPGESLRLQVEQLDERMFSWTLTVIGIAFFLAVSAQSASNWLSAAVLIVPGLVALVFVTRRLRQVVFERQDYHLGFLGERATAQCLTPLISDGYEIFHDLMVADAVASKVPVVLISLPHDYEIDFMVGWPDFVFANMPRPVSAKLFRRASTWI